VIAATVIGDAALAARLAAMPEAVKGGLARAVERLSQELRNTVQRKLSGEVLQQRTGRLASSLDVELTQSGGMIGARLSNMPRSTNTAARSGRVRRCRAALACWPSHGRGSSAFSRGSRSRP
jgi:hypothetical protein